MGREPDGLERGSVTVPACTNCLFFHAGTTDAFKIPDGQCRRYAPQGPTLGTQERGWQAFPPMVSWHWCGDYKPDPAATQRATVAA